MRYYYRGKNDQLIGPFDVDRLRGCLSRGSIEAETLLSPESGPGSDPIDRVWLPLRTALPKLLSGLAGSGSVTPTARLGASQGRRTVDSKLAPSRPVLACAVGLLAAFFMPWIQLFGTGMSGYNLGRLGSYANYAWIIPMLVGATIWISLSGANNRVLGAVSGIVPLGAILYVLTRLGVAGGSDATSGAMNMAGRVLGIGAWLTIVLSIAIIIAALVPADATGEAHIAPAGGLSTAGASKPRATDGPSAPRADKISGELTRLAELHSKGVLNADEFKAAKAKLLA